MRPEGIYQSKINCMSSTPMFGCLDFVMKLGAVALFGARSHGMQATRSSTPTSGTFLAHLSRRLVGELIVYPWSGVRPASAVRRPQFQT